MSRGKKHWTMEGFGKYESKPPILSDHGCPESQKRGYVDAGMGLKLRRYLCLVSYPCEKADTRKQHGDRCA